MENINEIRANALIEIKSWGGLGPAPGSHSTIITNDNKLYYYHEYVFNSSFLIENNIPQVSLSKGIDLQEDIMNEVISFIEQEIIGKTYEFKRIFDASFTVRGHYKDYDYNIVNSTDYETKTGLYDKAVVLIRNIEGKIKNEKNK